MATSASSLSFGSVVTTGGITRLSGTSSNLDIEGLVTSLVEAKKIPAVRLETRIAANDAKQAALEDLRAILGEIRSAVAGLRNPPGTLGINDNLFEQKEAYLSADTTVSPAAIVGVSASNRAQPGSFELRVEQLAAAQKLATASVTGLDQKLQDAFGGFAGSLVLGLGGGSTAEIAVDGTMTIQDLRNAINSRSATTGIAATVLQVSSSEARLILTAQSTGRAITLANGAGDDVLATLGISADGGATVQNPIQAARPARFSIDGVTIERASNKVEDVLQGVTLNLYKSEPGTTVTVEIERSLGAVQDQVTRLVGAYNTFRDFIDQHNVVGADGTVSSDSPLFGNSFLRDMQLKVASILGGAATGAGGGSLREIGITLDPSNRMRIDADKLGNALLTNLDRVRDILEFRFESNSADLVLFSRSGALQDTSFTIDIVDSDNDGQIDSASIDGVVVDVAGKVIKGRDGTPYAGLQFLWSGTGSASVAVTASQGLADLAYDELSRVLDETDGRLAREIEQVEGSTAKAQADIDRITERADRYRDQLIIRFTALETALGQAKAMLQQIRAALGQTDEQ